MKKHAEAMRFLALTLIVAASCAMPSDPDKGTASVSKGSL
jgi:hypothetical protein